ncbi:MAG TPA: hypothetical protein VHV82_08210 [Sporichthyaceae bacterium]|jgi:hypothetical protein|nr:hypothetical protein [Sporichthyaceae bacterium]
MHEGADIDGLLAVFVRFVDQSTGPEASLTATLTVEGLVITGDLIPHWRWFRLMQGLMGSAGGSSAEGMTAAFETLATDLLGAALIQDATAGPGDDSTPEEDPPLPTVLHMANARLLGDGHQGALLPGGLWRGRISAVSGWTIGRIDP